MKKEGPKKDIPRDIPKIDSEKAKEIAQRWLGEKIEKIHFIYAEVITTENTYFRKLIEICKSKDKVSAAYGAKKINPGEMTQAEAEELIDKVNELRIIQKELYDAIINVPNSENQEFISNLNEKFKQLQKTQTEYMILYKKCGTKPLPKEVSKLSFEGKLSLSDLFITPVQRFPRYGLLFNDLLKSMDKKNPNYNSLEKFTNDIKEITLEINYKVAKFEFETVETHLKQKDRINEIKTTLNVTKDRKTRTKLKNELNQLNGSIVNLTPMEIKTAMELYTSILTYEKEQKKKEEEQKKNLPQAPPPPRPTSLPPMPKDVLPPAPPPRPTSLPPMRTVPKTVIDSSTAPSTVVGPGGPPATAAKPVAQSATKPVQEATIPTTLVKPSRPTRNPQILKLFEKQYDHKALNRPKLKTPEESVAPKPTDSTPPEPPKSTKLK